MDLFETINKQYEEVENELAGFGLTLEPVDDGRGFLVKSADDDEDEDEDEGKFYHDLGDVADLLVHLRERYMKED